MVNKRKYIVSSAVKRLIKGRDLRSFNWFRANNFIKYNAKEKMYVLTRKGKILYGHLRK